MPAWCAATPASRPGEPRVVAEHVEVVVGERSRSVRVRRCAGARAVRRRSVSRTPAARHCSTAWSQPARLEHEHDRGQHLLVGQSRSTTSRAPRLVEPRPPGRGSRGRSAAVEPRGDRVRPRARPPSLDERRQQVQRSATAFADHVQVLELDRPAFLDDRPRSRRARSASTPRPPRRSTRSPTARRCRSRRAGG